MPTKSSNAWAPANVLRTAVIVAGVFVALCLLWVAREVFMLAFVGVLFGLTLSSAADRLTRWRVPRAAGAPIVLLLVLGSIIGLGVFAAPQVGGQIAEVRDQVPQVVGKVRKWVETQAGGVTEMLQDTTSGGGGQRKPAETTSSEGRNPIKELSPQISSVGHAFFTVFSSTLAALGGLILVVFVTLFVAIDPDLYHGGLMHLFPHRHRKRAGEVLSAMAFSLRRWLVTQFIAMVVIGVVTTGVLLLLGVRGAVALGIIAGLLEFVPLVGPIVSAIPAMAMALPDSPSKALYVAIAFTVIQQAENHLLIPLLMKDSLSLPPVLTILTQALMATVFGLLGLLIAVPLLGAVMVAIKMLYVEDVVGDEMEVPREAG